MTISFNLIRFQALAAGLGSFGVGAPDAGCVVPEDAYVVDDKVYTYTARSTDGKYEYGGGAYDIQTHTLARTIIYSSSNQNAKVDFAIAPMVDVYPAPQPVLDPIPDPFPPPRAFDNLILNGSHECSQENGATQVTVANNSGRYTTDQWLLSYNHVANTAVVKFQQIAPPGSPAMAQAFPKCLQVISSTAISSIGSTDFAAITQYIEGYRASALGFGSSAAQPLTMGFWVYATIPGSMSVSLRANAGGRSYVAVVQINAANTWEYKTINISGDVTGTWLKDTGVGVIVSFALAAGSSFPGTPNQWSGSNLFAGTGQTNFLTSNNNQVCLTGVSIWSGSYLPTAGNSASYKRGFEEELPKVRRYWQKLTLAIEHGSSASNDRALWTMNFDVPMRTTPTRTRLSTPVAVNIRASDPATYVVTNLLSENQITFSAEAAGVGVCSATVIETFNARM